MSAFGRGDWLVGKNSATNRTDCKLGSLVLTVTSGRVEKLILGIPPLAFCLVPGKFVCSGL